MANITNYLNKIKTAVYGKDVRGAIHDAIKQVYDDASVNHDNANMEVKMARGTHNTLNDRLDNVDEIQAQTNAQLSQIEKIIEFSDNENVTDKLQEAVKKGGKVKLHTDSCATAIVSNTILIGSNTTIELSPCATLKKGDNLNAPIFKNEDPVNGNKNIKLINGTYDFNRFGNANYDGHGILFNNVENLTYNNILFKNERKYCSLVCNCKNFTADNIRFDSNSDGLHFQPPLKCATIKNISGKTNDDLIAFTLGDYSAYEITNTGDMENILIDGVFSEGAKCCVKITGSGLNKNNVFKNISINNLFGECSQEIIAVINDTLGGNDHLTLTKVYGLKINNVRVKGAEYGGILLNQVDGDVQINNYSLNNKFYGIAVGGHLTQLQINNVDTPFAEETVGNYGFIYVQGSLDLLQLNNINYIYKNASQKILEVASNGSCSRTIINNLNLNGLTRQYINTFIYGGRSECQLLISNSNMIWGGLLFKSNCKLLVKLSNVYILDSHHNVEVTSTGDMRIECSNVTGMRADATIATGGKISINNENLVVSNVISSKINNPAKYDKIQHTGYDVDVNLYGLLMYNGNEWIKLYD